MSLKRVLEPYCNQPPRTGIRKLLSHLPIPEDPRTVCFRVHATARWARFKLSPRVFDSYRRFTVVRNPFDRAVSHFHFLQQSSVHHSHRHVRDLSFDEYLEFLKSRRWQRDPTQRARVVDTNGQLLCDRILRFESLATDFAALCGELGIHADVLPRRNASKHEPFANYYEKPATRAALLDLFAADFEAFGYPTTLD